MTLLTEEEARKKWCPHARAMIYAVNEGENAAVNRETKNCNCIASACMAWRRGYIANPNYNPQVWTSGRQEPHSIRDPQQRGYCGAFGSDSE